MVTDPHVTEPTRLPDPISRRDRQRQTREALIFTARAVFAEQGYAGANLEAIARQAGFSKGAVYSNFEGKAALFLAVMDANIEVALDGGGWDVFSRADDVAGDEDTELQLAMRGFALATLEFIGTAARDESLTADLTKRMRVLTDTYAGIAARSRAAGEPLTDAQLGALLAALDQGVGLLTLAGVSVIDQHAMRTGMQRLLDPLREVASRHDDAERASGQDDDAERASGHDDAAERASGHGTGTDAAADDAGQAARSGTLHDAVVRQRVVDSLREARG